MPMSANPPWYNGNIDIQRRPVVPNYDGSISTLRSMGINNFGQEVTIPTVLQRTPIDSEVVSPREAIQHYNRTNQYLGVSPNVKEANDYAQRLSNHMNTLYTRSLGSVYGR